MDFGEIQKLFATIEYRSLNHVERAILLHKKENLSLKISATACSISVGKLRRALQAKREGREIGVAGRPQHFNNNEKLKLVSDIKENIPQKKRRYDVLQNAVRRKYQAKILSI